MQSNNVKEIVGITALYCRLSRDDGKECESNSISNQKKMLKQKAKEYGFQNVKYYVDDGYTGTNFNRPGFQALLDDIETGYISVVMVKDLSRLGRDYVAVGHYTDIYFPDHNVRFIAINDLVDSDEGENEIAPFKNVMNEMYARDISRKVRSAHRIRGNMGEPLSQPPYGYMKDPTNPKRWIIDPEAAEVVRRIFRLCMEGKGNESIAHILMDDKVPVPMAYWKSKGFNRGGKKTQQDPYHWCKTTVEKILSQQEYCGDIINFKTYSKSFKNKRRIENDRENWVIFKNVHEPIIEREIFEQVQKLISHTKRRAPKKENGEKNMFSEMLYCADCGKKLWYHTNTVNREIHFFSCSNYKSDYRGSCPTRHYIRADAIEQVVMLELRKMASFLRDEEDAFIDLLTEKSNRDVLFESKRLQREIRRASERCETVSKLHEKLYEDNASGKVSDDWYMEQAHRYEVERMELMGKITAAKEELKKQEAMQIGRENFVGAIRKFMEMQTLTPVLLRELIDRIEVHETEGVGKNRTQRIVIHYRFIDTFTLPEERAKETYVADTRQGVAVEYLTVAVPAQQPASHTA